MALIALAMLLPAISHAASGSATSSALRLGASATVGVGNPTFLPVDQAFVFTPLQSGAELLLRWEMPPGYYLYRDRLSVAAGAVKLDLDMPAGEAKVDEYFGESQVFYQGMDASLVLPEGVSSVVIEYQGCADAGLCYPPVRRTMALQPY